MSYWDDEVTETPEGASESKSELEQLRETVEELKNLVSDKLDSAEDGVIRENRASEQAKAERAAAANSAASDPATLDELKRISSEQDLITFLTARGYNNGGTL